PDRAKCQPCGKRSATPVAFPRGTMTGGSAGQRLSASTHSDHKPRNTCVDLACWRRRNSSHRRTGPRKQGVHYENHHVLGGDVRHVARRQFTGYDSTTAATAKDAPGDAVERLRDLNVTEAQEAAIAGIREEYAPKIDDAIDELASVVKDE